MSAQGWSASDNLGENQSNKNETLKGFRGWRTLTGLTKFFELVSQGCRWSLQPWAKISERLRRISKLNQYQLTTDLEFSLAPNNQDHVPAGQHRIKIGPTVQGHHQQVARNE